MTIARMKKLIPKIALVIGVLIIPLMYSYFYLNAFWDPYQRLDDVPVAVVNLDEGAKLNGEEANLGMLICEELKDDGSLDFRLTSEEEARKGVLGDRYYASITIPKDFTANAATVGNDTEKLHGKVIYRANQKKNYLAAQILENAMTTIKESVNSKIDGLIVETLANTVEEVPQQLSKLDDGLGQLYDGSSQLESGTGRLADGAGAISAGISTLNGSVPALTKGAGALDKGAAQLSKGLTTLTDNNKALNKGANALGSGAGSLEKGVKQYTDGVASAGSGATSLSTGLSQYTDGVDQIAAGQKTLGDGLEKASAGVDQIASQVKSSASELEKQASDESLDALAGGAGQMSDGAKALDSAYEKFVTEEAPQLIEAYKATGDDTYRKQLIGAMSAFSTKMSELSSGASQVNMGVEDLTSGMKSVKGNIGELSKGLGQLQGAFGSADKEESILGGQAKLEAGLSSLQENNDTLTGGAKALDKGLKTINGNSKALKSGASKLSSGSNTLEKGIAAYTKGANKISTGAGQLSKGTGQLTGKLPALATGVGKLDQGAKSLASGTKQLSDGAEQLTGGIGTAKDGVGEAVGTANSQLGKLDGLAEYAEEPVSTKTEYVQPVKNYGSAFAPYFMGLSLWVGGLLIFFGIYYDFNRRIKTLTRDSNRFVLRTLFFSLVSIGQGILLAFVIKSVLHIHVNNPMMLYGACILVAMTFTAIIQFCIVDLGDIGKFLAMLLLILQLTSCAGTFPLETQSGFFQAINPYLPMTYSTQLFKEAISGTAGSNAAHSAVILFAFFAAFVALTLIFSHKAISKDLHRIAGEAKA